MSVKCKLNESNDRTERARPKLRQTVMKGAGSPLWDEASEERRGRACR